jgi:hypothetical protein
MDFGSKGDVTARFRGQVLTAGVIRYSEQRLRLGVQCSCSDGRRCLSESGPPAGRKRQFCAELERVTTCYATRLIVRPSFAFTSVKKTPVVIPLHCTLAIPSLLSAVCNIKITMSRPTEKKHKLVRIRLEESQSSMGPGSQPLPGLAYSAVLKGQANPSSSKPTLRPPFPAEFIPQSAQGHSISQNPLTDMRREFPSLSNNSQLPSTTQGSMWSTAGSRNIGGPIQRSQPTQGSSQQGGQDDLFGPPSSRMQPNQGPFRFGAQPSQVQPNSVDDFPPLNRTSNGEIGSERGGNVMSSIGFGPQNPVSSGLMQSGGGNGLLNALTATSRASDVRSPPAIGTPNGEKAPEFFLLSCTHLARA